MLCFNERLQRDVRESCRREVLYAQTQLAQDKSIKPGLERFFDARGHLLSAQLAQVEEFDGYSCLFCTRALPENKMLSLYFNKDIVEKAFRSLKGITQLRPVRHWLAERVHAHIFICYLAYLLLSLLPYRLRNTEFTAQSALLELATMYKVYLRDSQHRFKLSRVVALTKKQETILKTIDRALLKAHEDDLYEAMDWLFERKKRIEKKLAAGHLTEGGLVPYDVSSNFYEGAPARGFSPRAFERDHSFLRRCKLPILRFIF